jgi:vacuolar-type H+-ATPase subunit D/Vma8
MEHIGSTRAELLVKQRQTALARQGRELLQEKRQALLRELMRTAEQIMRSGGSL